MRTTQFERGLVGSIPDAWTYLSGLATQRLWDGPSGLEKRGPHDVRDWVEGRVEDGSSAYRVRRLANAFEMWRKQ